MQTETIFMSHFEPSKENIHPSYSKESQKQPPSQKIKIASLVYNEN